MNSLKPFHASYLAVGALMSSPNPLVVAGTLAAQMFYIGVTAVPTDNDRASMFGSLSFDVNEFLKKADADSPQVVAFLETSATMLKGHISDIADPERITFLLGQFDLGRDTIANSSDPDKMELLVMTGQVTAALRDQLTKLGIDDADRQRVRGSGQGIDGKPANEGGDLREAVAA